MFYMIFVTSSSTWVYIEFVVSQRDTARREGRAQTGNVECCRRAGLLQEVTGSCGGICSRRRNNQGAEGTLNEVGTTHLHVFQTILLAYTSQHIFLAAFLHLASQQEFVQYKVCLLKVEDDVQLAYISIVLVHLFDVSVDDFEGNQLIIC